MGYSHLWCSVSEEKSQYEITGNNIINIKSKRTKIKIFLVCHSCSQEEDYLYMIPLNPPSDLVLPFLYAKASKATMTPLVTQYRY